MNKSELVTIREARPDDKSFIYSSWLKGLRFGNKWFEAIDQDTYFQRYHDVIEALLSRPDTSVKVACLVEDPDVILGYSVYTGQTVHFVFVKRAWRGIGIARSLVPPDLTTVTHLTDSGKAILIKHHLKFDPFF